MITFNKNSILIGATGLAIIIMALIVAGTFFGFGMPVFGAKATAQRTIDYINKNLIVPGKTATLGEVTVVSGIIKMQVKVGEESFYSYVTKDGKLFFEDVIALDK